MLLLFFSFVKYSRWRRRCQRNSLGESHGFCYDTLHRKNNRLLFFIMAMFLSLFSKSYPSTHAPFSQPLLAGSDGTIISCYSHKSSYFGKTFLQKWSDKFQGMISLKTLRQSVCSKNKPLLWIFYVFVLSCVCSVFVHVCLYVLCGHLLGKGWPLGSRLWCLTVNLSLSHLYPGSGVVLGCIDSWSLHPYFQYA